MAVYTDVSAEELAAFLAGYDIGELLSYKGIAEGVENSNFLVHTSRGNFILTLYEKRVAAGDLPFFLGLMEHLAARGITCPQPVQEPRRRGARHASPGGRPRSSPSSTACGSAGRAPAIARRSARRWRELHLAGADFPGKRANALSVAGWRPLFEHGGGARRRACSPASRRPDRARARRMLESAWPRDLPQGVIHADLFPDNVFFLGDKLSGLIDFYFACTDALAYDVAICLNAWCFEPDHSYNVTKGRSLLQAYAAVRPLSAAERAGAAAAGARRGAALPADAAGRLAQRAARRAGAAEGPAGIFPQAALPPDGQQRARLRPAIERARA